MDKTSFHGAMEREDKGEREKKERKKEGRKRHRML